MAKTDFSKYFRFALYDYKSLAIPGLGMINLQRNSAFADVVNQQVYPPKYDVKFQNDVSANSYQTYELLKSYLPELTRSDFDSYMNARVAELNSTGQTNIEGIGKLSNADGGLVFQPFPETTNLLTYGLNRLGLKKVTNFIQTNQMNEVQILPGVSPIWSIFLPLLIAALLLASSIAYLSRDLKPIEKQISNITITPPKPKDTINNSSIIDTSSKLIIGKEAIVSDILKNSDGSYIKKCVIITGAFKSAKYRDLMIEKLRDSGYDIFTEKKGRLTRVGLQFECHEKDLEKYLQAVRETLEKEAWYLDELMNKEG